MTLENAPQVVASSFVYDVFAVHAAADESFVQGYLLPALGLPSDRVLLPRTLDLGMPILAEIERGVRSSRVTVVVLSPACLADNWAVFGEQIAAWGSVARDIHGVLLPLLLTDCDLPVHIRALVALDFRPPARERWDAEVARLRAYLARSAVPAPSLPCPYPGMRSFTERDAGRFFGRDVEIEQIIHRLRRGEREIYVIGASGSGKSSLVAAGLVPRLARGVEGLPCFHVESLRPGEQPLARLADALAGEFTDPAAAVGGLLARHAPADSLCLVIDQLEELFAIVADDQRQRFLAVLRELCADPRCVLVFTLRADFYGTFLNSPLWSEREGKIGRIDLGPLRGDSLRAVIEQPARDVGVYFQTELVSQLLDDADREPGLLPLLQETLVQLWGKRRQRLLVVADYRAMGDGKRTGLAFAVKEHADSVLGALPDAQRAIALRILLRLVNFGEGRADTRRQQMRDALRSDGEPAADFDAALRQLVDHRLVTVTCDEQCGDVLVDLAHEILIQAWSTFADAIHAWRALEQRRRELESASVAWRTRGSGDGGLLDSIEIASAIEWRAKAMPHVGHSPDLAAFLAASETARSRSIMRRRSTVLGISLLAAAATILALVAWREATEADRQRRDALAQRDQRNQLIAESGQFFQEIGRQRLLEEERPLEALPFLVEARRIAETIGSNPGVSLRMLFAQATRNLPMCPSPQHPDLVVYAAFSADGARVITSSRDGTAGVCDAVSGTLVFPPLQSVSIVTGMAFSPDGARVAIVTSETVRVWDAATGAPVSPPLPHQEMVTSAAFSPDGARVVTVGQRKAAQTWDVRTGKQLALFQHSPRSIVSAAFSPDGTRIVTASRDQTARVWDAVTGKPLSSPMRHQHAVVSAAFSPDGTRIVTASTDQTARVWDAATGRPRSPPLKHQGNVVSATFSPDGARVVTASWDNTARVWDAATGKPLSPALQHQGYVMSAAFSPEGMRLVTASDDRTARVWDAGTGEPLSFPFQHRDFVANAAFTPDGSRVVTATWYHSAQVWDATDKLASLRLQHQGPVRSSAFSPDGRRVITASWDKTARVWDAITGKPLSSPLQHHDIVVRATFSPDGRRVVTASADHTARVWDATTGKPLSPPLQHLEPVYAAVFSPDGHRVVTASEDHTARVWDVVTGRELSSPLHHPDDVSAVAFSSDGNHVITISHRGPAQVWDTATGKLLSPPLPPYVFPAGVAINSDATRVVADEGNSARVWDVATRKPLSPPLNHQRRIRDAAFSPDGTRVVTASEDYTARVWDIATGKPLSPALQHQSFVWSVAFSPDGTRVVTASGDSTARVWDATTGKPLSPRLQHQKSVWVAAFSPDGTRILTASDDHTARIWDLPLDSRTLVEWRAIRDRVSPYVLANGVLLSRDVGDNASSGTPSP